MRYNNKKGFFKFKFIFVILFSFSFVFSATNDFETPIEDSLSLVWTPILYSDIINYNNIFNFGIFINYSNIGYVNDSTFYTSEEKLKVNFYYLPDDNCYVNNRPILNIKNYYEFDYSLEEKNFNKLEIECDSKTITKYVYYDSKLKVPIYNVLPEATNKMNFNVQFQSYTDIKNNECVLYHIDDENVKEYSFNKIDDIYYSINDFSFTNLDEFQFQLNCSKQGYSDYLKGFELGESSTESSEEWIVYYDDKINIHLLNLSSETEEYNLMDEEYQVPYTKDDLVFSKKDLKLKFDINESGILEIKNLYYSPQEKYFEFDNETVEYSFSIGKYFMGEDYVNNNQIEFKIKDIANNNIFKSYKLIYESEDVDIVVNDIDGNLYGDFVVVIENYKNTNENLKIDGELIDLSNCKTINEDNDIICEINATNIIDDLSLNDNQEKDFFISITLKNGSELSKQYHWIKNIYEFEYNIIENNKLSNTMPLFKNTLPIKLNFNKEKDSFFKIKIEDNIKNEENIYEYNNEIVKSNLDKISSGINKEFQYGFNFITVTFFVNDSEKYKFEYVFYVKEDLEFIIDKLNYRSNFDLFSDYNFQEKYAVCGNGICEFENCEQDCEKGLVEEINANLNSYQYDVDNRQHIIDLTKDMKDYKIYIQMYDNFQNAINEFKSLTFEDFNIINDYVIFKDDNEYFYLSGNIILKYIDEDKEEDLSFLNEMGEKLLSNYRSKSFIKYRNILESNQYNGTIDFLPNNIDKCVSVEKIDLFDYGENIYCNKSTSDFPTSTQKIVGDFVKYTENKAIIKSDNNLIISRFSNQVSFGKEYYNSQLKIN